MPISTKLADISIGGSPLREFTGIFAEYSEKQNTYSNKTSSFAVLNFTDIQVIKSAIPYKLPVASLELKATYTKTGQLDGRYGFGHTNNSVEHNFPGMIQDFLELQGHKLHLIAIEQTATIEGKLNTYYLWEVIGIDGKSKDTPVQSVVVPKAVDPNMTEAMFIAHLLTIIDNKNMLDFSKAVIADPVFKSAPQDFTNKFYNQYYLKQCTDSKQVVEENNLYKVVKS